MKKGMVIPTLLLGSLLFGSLSPVFANPGWGNDFGTGESCPGTVDEHNKRLEHRMAMMAEILDLNQDQQGQIRQLLADHFAQNQGKREELKMNRETLREQLRSYSFDAQSFRALAGKHAELKTELLVGRARMKQQIFAILTHEQQEKAEKLLNLRGPNHHDRHELNF